MYQWRIQEGRRQCISGKFFLKTVLRYGKLDGWGVAHTLDPLCVQFVHGIYPMSLPLVPYGNSR